LPITDPWFYLVAAPAILIVSISKGGFGGGLALLGVPMMSLVMPPARAAAIMLPILLVMDAFSVWAYRRRYDRGVLAAMLPGAVVGVALGGLAFGILDDRLMRLIVGMIALGFVAQHLIGGAKLGRARMPKPWFGGICGALAGFTSTIAHAGGPPAALYLLPLRLDKTALAGTLVMLFAAINVMKLAPYAAVGQLTGLNLMTSLVLAPLAPLGVWLGVRLHRQVHETLFYRLAYGFVAITGLKLIYDAFAGL